MIIKKHLSRKYGNAPIILCDPVLEEKLREDATGDQLPPSLLPSCLGEGLSKYPLGAVRVQRMHNDSQR